MDDKLNEFKQNTDKNIERIFIAIKETTLNVNNLNNTVKQLVETTSDLMKSDKKNNIDIRIILLKIGAIILAAIVGSIITKFNIADTNDNSSVKTQAKPMICDVTEMKQPEMKLIETQISFYT